MGVTRRRERGRSILVKVHGTPEEKRPSEIRHSVQQREANKMTVNVSTSTLILHFVMEKNLSLFP